MAEEKVYCYDNPSGNNSAELMALMNNGNQWNNPWIYMVWMMMFRNGLWGNNNETENYNSRAIAQLQDSVNTNHNNDLAMQAINGNREALATLAGNLNVGVTSLSDAISSIKSSIDLVGTQTGLGAERVVNSVLLGNKDLVQQIATCCCENKQLVTTMGYEGQLRDATNTATLTSRIDQLSNGIAQGFSSTAYATQAQTSSLSKDLQSQTQTIIDKISSLEANAQQDKINTLTAQLTAANARAERAAELQPIIAQLNSIKNAQPSTVAVQYPQLTAVPNYVAYGNSSFWN